METKLDARSAREMLRRAIEEIPPYRLMPAPAYVLLKRNEKLIAIKRSLDFFTSQELEKIRAYELLYFPQISADSKRYIDIARRLKRVLQNEEASEFEISSFCWKELASIWTTGGGPDPILAVLLAEELCEPLPAEVLVGARDRNVSAFELGVKGASLSVLLALCLGFCEGNFLNRLRLRAFLRAMNGVQQDDGSGEIGELIHLSFLLASGEQTQIQATSRAGAKLARRIEIVKGQANG